MAFKVTEEMIAGWTWEKNALRAPNGRISVYCTRGTSFSMKLKHSEVVWHATVHAVGAVSAYQTPGVPGSAGGHIGGVRGQSSRLAAALEGLSRMFTHERTPSNVDIAGLHPAFATELRRVRAQRAADAAAAALGSAITERDRLTKLLAELPARIADLEARIPALNETAKAAQAALAEVQP